MPFIRVETSAPFSDDQRKALLAGLTKIAVQVIGKPEDYVMTSLAPAAMSMAGARDPAAFVDLRSIGGLGSGNTYKLAEQISGLLHDTLGLAPERIFMNFTDVPGSAWGWNGRTLG